MLKLDTRQLVDHARILAAAGKRAPQVIARSMNHAGDRGFTVVKSTLAKEMGIRAGKVAEGLSKRRAFPGRLEYRITGRGAAISLKEFKARQTRPGVSAAPWGQRRVFKSTFVVGSLGGHVFKRTGSSRSPIEKLWGPSIPREMVQGATYDAFQTTVVGRLGERVAHELARLAARGR